jgi:hypothetical protein
MEFTHKNHYKFGWGTGTYNFQERDSGDYWTSYSPAEYNPGPGAVRRESVRAAKLIAESAQKPLAVMFSGGMDSEAVCRALIEADIDFECIVSVYNYRGQKHINDYDTSYAFDFIKKHGIPYRIFEIDLLDFLLTKYADLAKRFSCSNQTWLLHTYVLSQFPEKHVICGGGDIQLNRWAYKDHDMTPNPSDLDTTMKMGLFVEEKSHIVSAYDWAQTIGSNCSLRFFRQTAELMLAWLEDTDVQHYINFEKSLTCYIRRGVHQMHFLQLKPWVFHKYWDLTPRVKYHGFEKIYSWLYLPNNEPTGVSHITSKDEYAPVREVIDHVWNTYPSQSFYIDVHDLHKQLLPT